MGERFLWPPQAIILFFAKAEELFPLTRLQKNTHGADSEFEVDKRKILKTAQAPAKNKTENLPSGIKAGTKKRFGSRNWRGQAEDAPPWGRHHRQDAPLQVA